MWITLTVTGFQLAGFLTSIKAIMETRTSQGAIAWAVALNAIPYLAVPAYFVFGRSKFAGYVHSRKGKTLSDNPTAKKLAADME